jgi:hypothetical protein
MRVVVRPHHDRGVEPPPALKPRFDAVSRFELPLFLFGLS